MAVQQPRQIDIIRQILGGEEMPKQYQCGKLEIRDDVKRPYYIVRSSVPKRMKDGQLKKFAFNSKSASLTR